MHYRFLLLLVAACISVGFTQRDLAAGMITVAGTLQNVPQDSDSPVGTSIDYWYFSTGGGPITFDVLSWEFDLNGGEIEFIDSHLFLFREHGTLGPEDLVDENDDAAFTDPFGFDGSLFPLDSYLAIPDLPAGDYILAIGAAPLFSPLEELDLSGVLAGFGPANAAVRYESGTLFLEESPRGDYQITFTGDLTRGPQLAAVIPEPASFTLFAVGGAIALGVQRRRRQRRARV